MKNILLFACFVVIIFLLIANSRLTQQNIKVKQQDDASEGNSKDSVSIDNKSRCQKDGQAFIDAQKDTISTPDMIFHTNRSRYEFLYSQGLNSCLVSWQDTMLVNKELTTTYKITDIYSNTDVAVCGYKYKDGKLYGLFNTKDAYSLKLAELGFKDWIKCVSDEENTSK